MNTPTSTSSRQQGTVVAASGWPPLAGEFLRVGGITLCVFALFAWFSLHSWPYGIATVGAERVLSGEVPYRDFWTVYAPGDFYLLAALFAVFGHENLVSTIAGSLLSALAVGLSFRLMWKITGHPAYGVVCATLFTAAFLATNYYGALYTYPPVIFCLMLAFNFLNSYLDSGRKAFLSAAGLAVGFAILFKHDVGGYGGMAMVAGLSVHHVAAGGTDRLRRIARDLVGFGLAGASPVLPVIVALALVAGRDALQDLIVLPATYLRYTRIETYPSLLPVGLHDPWMVQWLLNWSRYAHFALPVLAWMGSLPVIVAASRPGNAKIAGFGVTFAVIFVLHYVGAQVNINHHIISMTFYGACLGSLSLHFLQQRFGLAHAAWMKACALLVAAGWFVALGAQPFYDRVAEDLLIGRTSETVPLRLAKASQFRLRPDEAADVRALANFVQARVPPGQAIYIGTHRHDVVVTGKTALYFLLDRPPATKYHDLHPGITDTGPVQAEMIRDLEEKNVHLLVLMHMFGDDLLDELKALKQPNLPLTGARDLDAFIRSNYEQVQQLGLYAVWLKKT
jgi:hypothetical protein